MIEEYTRILGEFHDPVLDETLSIDSDRQVLFSDRYDPNKRLLVMMTLPETFEAGSLTHLSINGDIDFSPEDMAGNLLVVGVLRRLIQRRDELRQIGYQRYEGDFKVSPQGEILSLEYEIPIESEDGLRKIIRDFGPGLW